MYNNMATIRRRIRQADAAEGKVIADYGPDTDYEPEELDP